MDKNLALESYILNNFFRYSSENLESYEYSIKRFYDTWPEIINLEDFTSDHIDEYVECMAMAGKAGATIYHDISAIRSLYKFTSEDSPSLIDITRVELPPIIKTLPRVLTRETILRLRDKSKDKINYRTMVEVLKASGVRVGELTSMLIENVELERRLIHIPQAKDLEQRYVLFTHTCSEWIKRLLNERKDKDGSPFLFVNRFNLPFSRQGVWKILKDYSTDLDLPVSVTPHDFRRTFATVLFRNGMKIEKIAKLMGHKHIATTARYISLAPSEYGKAIRIWN